MAVDADDEGAEVFGDDDDGVGFGEACGAAGTGGLISCDVVVDGFS